jgi:hypothetical protein
LRGDDGEARAGVARRGLDDRAARFEQAVALGGVDHRHRRPVLDAATRVEELDLGEEVALEVATDPTETHQWRVAHQVEQRVGHVHRHGLATLPVVVVGVFE